MERGIDTAPLRRRRQARSRAIRRRRLAAALLGAVVVAAVVALAAQAPGGSGSRHGGSSAAASRAHRAGVRRPPGTRGAGTGAASAARAPSGPPGTAPVPILMYHVIASPPAGAPFPGLYVSPSEFAAQMQALASAGWHAVTLDQLAAYWEGGVPLGAGKPIVLTFDNGYQSQYTQALPVLRRLGWVGDENIQLTGLPPSQGGLSSAQVRGLLAAGWELDTQGISHADLVTLDPEQLRYQVGSARTILQRRYRVPVSWFCYPSGHYDEAVIDAVRAAGYVGSTTVIPGWAHPGDDRYRLHRLRVLGGTSAAELLALIAGAREDAPAPPSYDG